MDLDIYEIFDMVTANNKPQPKSIELGFELDNLKELFEFLLQFVTMLCKHYHSDNNGHVDLTTLTPADFQSIDAYMQSIGFTCAFQAMPATSDNLNWANTTRYDRILISSATQLQDLHFGLKCGTTLYVISFNHL